MHAMYSAAIDRNVVHLLPGRNPIHLSSCTHKRMLDPVTLNQGTKTCSRPCVLTSRCRIQVENMKNFEDLRMKVYLR